MPARDPPSLNVWAYRHGKIIANRGLQGQADQGHRSFLLAQWSSPCYVEPSMDLRGYPALLLAGILFIFPACSVFKSAPTIRPALAASACKPPIVAQNNQAGMTLYNEHRFEDAKAKF